MAASDVLKGWEGWEEGDWHSHGFDRIRYRRHCDVAILMRRRGPGDDWWVVSNYIPVSKHVGFGPLPRLDAEALADVLNAIGIFPEGWKYEAA